MRDALRNFRSRFASAIAPSREFPTWQTDRNNLVRLLERLHPVSTNRELIRLGPAGDGGYLLPDNLDAVEACFSPGVNLVSGFEKECADRGMRVFLADKSVEGPAEEHPLFSFSKKFIGCTSDEDFMTLDGWVDDCALKNDSDLLLQIDIEGYEYGVFLSASAALMNRFRIIVAEFHELDQLWNASFFGLAKRTFDKILQTHTCVLLPPNNCIEAVSRSGLDLPPIVEMTFLRNDRIESQVYQSKFPHPLDFDNTSKPTLPLPRCWYSNAAS